VWRVAAAGCAPQVDSTLVYEPFAFDFGPLNVGCTYTFCELLRTKLRDPSLAGKRIYFICTASDARFVTNAAVLIAAYMVIWEKQSAQDACVRRLLPPWHAARSVC
jgi:cell division cycle 14